MRPIVAQSCSLLKPTAQFIDHLLQPLAQSYPDYLQNFTELSIILKDIDVTDDAILVTMDVNSLYPDRNATPDIYRNVQKAISSSHRSKPCNSAAPYLYQLQLFRIRLTYI